MKATSRPAKRVVIACGTGLLVFLCAGCGGDGGGASLLIKSGNGSITESDPQLVDGSHGDTYTFMARRYGMVAVSMSSTQVDSYVVVWAGTDSDYNTYTYIGEANDSGVGFDALLIFEASAQSWYSFRCCTYGADDFGSYKYAVTYVDNRALAARKWTGSGKPAKTADDKRLTDKN